MSSTYILLQKRNNFNDYCFHIIKQKLRKRHDIIAKTMSCDFNIVCVTIELENYEGDKYEKNYLPFVINFFDRGGIYGLQQ